ncbi:MAG: hypothetical protein CMJ39_00900 [Phycisphaerae bacterium]|nr:hypothetical protein [Phycisphaerae bacterium]
MSRLLAVFFVVFIFIYLLPLGARPIVTPDEGRYGAIPAEMLETGEWVAPRLNGIRYFEKPVLGYWLVAASQSVFGKNSWALRLPSALGIGFAGLCLALLARRQRLRPEAGWLAGLSLLTMLGSVIGGTVATLDAMFTGALVGAITFFYMAWTSPPGAARFGWQILFGGFCGLSFLIKGFLGLAIPTMVIAPFLLWMWRWRDIFLMPWIPMLAAGLVIAPWAIAVHLADGDFWHYFFWVEHIHRFTGGAEAQHPEPFWFFGPVLLAMAFPWTFAGILAIAGLGRRSLEEPWLRFALCWLFIPLIFFSISSGKLPTYIMPCLPAVALLMAVGLLERFEHQPEKRSLKWVYPSIILVIMGVLAFIEWGLGLIDPSPWGEGGSWRFALIGTGLLLWAALDLAAVSTTRANRRVLLMALSPVLMLMFIPLLLPTNWLSGYKAPRTFMEVHQDALGDPDAIIVSASELVHAVNWFYDRYDVLLFEGAGELRWGITNGQPERLLSEWRLRDLITRESPHRRVVVLLRHGEQMDRVLAYPELPEPAVLDRGHEIGVAIYGPDSLPSGG